MGIPIYFSIYFWISGFGVDTLFKKNPSIQNTPAKSEILKTISNNWSNLFWKYGTQEQQRRQILQVYAIIDRHSTQAVSSNSSCREIAKMK